jgi:hypothetical protein
MATKIDTLDVMMLLEKLTIDVKVLSYNFVYFDACYNVNFSRVPG